LVRTGAPLRETRRALIVLHLFFEKLPAMRRFDPNRWKTYMLLLQSTLAWSGLKRSIG
jgi:hypothetical protein